MRREKPREQRIRELKIRAMKTRESRPENPTWTYLIETDPDMFEAYQNVYEQGLLSGKTLPVKYRELVAIAILAYRGSPATISHAIRACKHYGLTKQELLDAAKTSLIPGGAPTFNMFIDCVRAIEEEERKGIK